MINVVIKKCAVGYGVYEGPYWFCHNKIEGLYHTARTKEECEQYAREHNMNYRIEDTDPSGER